MQDDSYQWPPELMALLVDVIPLLCRSKDDVLGFLRGAGANATTLGEFQRQLSEDRASVNKYQIARTVLAELNQQGDRGLAARREVIRRVTEFEEFSTCWPDDQLKAKGLVADIRRVVNVKDSFTRLQQEREAEREAERHKRQAAQKQKEAAALERRRRYQSLHAELSALSQIPNPQKRGTALETLLNKIFAAEGLSIRDSFVLRREDGQAAEQIDGAIELDGSQYAVEVKWWAKPLGRPDVSEHLVRLFSRAEVRGLMISASGFAAPAIEECQRALSQRVMVLGEVRELLLLLEQERDIAEWLREKVRRATLERQPLSVLGVDF